MGFFLGPKLNAAGRLESADISLKLLTSKSKTEVTFLANQIDTLNKRRQTIEALIMEQITQIDSSQNFICAYNDDWHIGVIGIIAGKLKEVYNLPTFVITFDKDGHGHGSARSVDDVDLSAIIREALKRKILTKGGGHKMAAGLSLEEVKKIIFAYEPIWAIGTGKTASSSEAQEVIGFAKKLLSDKFNIDKNEIIMLYGGSLKPSNAKELLSQEDIDGGLIGGACLKMEDFKSIIYTNLE